MATGGAYQIWHNRLREAPQRGVARDRYSELRFALGKGQGRLGHAQGAREVARGSR